LSTIVIGKYFPLVLESECEACGTVLDSADWIHNCILPIVRSGVMSLEIWVLKVELITICNIYFFFGMFVKLF
jgi:hypothetical protein